MFKEIMDYGQEWSIREEEDILREDDLWIEENWF